MNIARTLCASVPPRLCVKSNDANMRTTLPLLAAVLTLIVNMGAGAADPLPPGLVKDQPTTGRFVKTDQGYMVA